MALKDSRGAREYDKFVADGSGDASVRVTSTTSVTTTTAVETGAGGSASGTGTATGTGETIILVGTDVSGKSRMGIQIFNTGDTNATQGATYKVYGSLLASAPTNPPGGSNWTQIGDNINIARSSNAYKAISTTPIKWISVTGEATDDDFLSDGGETATTTNLYLMAD